MAPLNKKRCFAFGCSYTNYVWPTFADLVGCNFEEFYNFGLSGSDNTYALNRLIDTHSHFQLNPETDFVIYGVTGFGRFTYWDRNHDWIAQGDVNFSERKDPRKNNFLRLENYSPIYAAYRSINAIKIFKNFLQATNIPHIIYPALDNAEFYNYRVYQYERPSFLPIITKECEAVQDLYDIKTSIDEYLLDIDEFHTKTYLKDENITMTHPTTNQHYGYLKKYFSHYDTDRVKNIVNQFQSKEYKNAHELNDLMAKKFALLYRKDVSIEPSLFLKYNKDYRNMLKKYRDSGV